MSDWMGSFHFLRPWWWLLTVVWLPLLWWRMRAVQRGSVLHRLVDAELLPHLLVRAGRAQRWPWLLAGLAGVLLTMALAGPTWQRVSQPLYRGGAAQVVVVSLSQHMLARDVKPDRMQRVRFKVHDLLHAHANGRNALVAYAGAAFTVAPLTTDAHALDDLVDALAPEVMPVPGNDAAKGIARGARLLRQARVHGGSLVVVTDSVDADAIAAAREAHAKGIRVSVLGVGKTRGVPVHLPTGGVLTDASGNKVMARRDDASLQALADAGGGIYVPMRTDHADIKALTEELRASHRAQMPAHTESDRWRDMGPWLVLPLLLLAALAFRRGWLLVLPLALLPWCMSAPARAAAPASAPAAGIDKHAGETADGPPMTWHGASSWWRNADQRAAQALAAGHARRAEQLASSSALRGAAAYRAGDFTTAARAFADTPGADAAYNLGNALAKQGHYRKAIEAYDRALKLDPHHADARANRKAVRAWLRKHQNKPSSRSAHGKSGADNSAGKQRKTNDRATQNGKTGGPKGPARSTSASPDAQPTPRSSQSHSRPASPGSSGHPAQTERPPDADQARKQQAEARRASRALRRQMQGKAGQRDGQGKQSFNLGAVPAHAGSVDPLPQPMQRALQRVPDDPGGLLRRKFLLEYQQRHGRLHGGQR